MIRQIAPQFFTLDIKATLAYYEERLGFRCKDCDGRLLAFGSDLKLAGRARG